MKALQSLVLCLALLCGRRLWERRRPVAVGGQRGIDGDEGQSARLTAMATSISLAVLTEIATFGNHTLTTGGGKISLSPNWTPPATGSGPIKREEQTATMELISLWMAKVTPG